MLVGRVRCAGGPAEAADGHLVVFIEGMGAVDRLAMDVWLGGA